MFSWIQLALLLLQIAKTLIDRQHERGLITEGEDREIARQNAEMLKRSSAAKKILADITALPDSSVDALLRSLEPVEKRADK